MPRTIFFLILLFLYLPTGLLAASPTAFVVNSTGETLSKIDLASGTVTNNIVTLGTDINSFPNQIVVRDTLAYVVASGTDEIQVINLNTEQTIRFFNTGPGSNPYWMAFYDSQYVYITLLLTDRIAKLDLVNETISYFNTGTAPSGVVIYDHKLFVICSNYDFVNFQTNLSDIYIYDIGPDTLITTVPIGENAQYADVDGLGRIHAVATGDYFSTFGEVYIVDGGDYTIVDHFPVGGSPGQITIGPDNIAYLAAAGFSFAGYIFSYNALTGEIYHDNGNPIEVDLNCITAIPYQDSTIYSGSFTDYINVVDSSGQNLNSYAVGSGPSHLAFNYLPGDVNGDFEVNVLDILYYIDYKFKDGPDLPWPRWRGNVNADYTCNVLDIIALINYKFKSGPPPKVGPTWFEVFPED